jgi:hypothetical protein
MKAVLFLELPGQMARVFPVDAAPAAIAELAAAGRNPAAGHYTSVLVRTNEDGAKLRAAGLQSSGANHHEVDRLFAYWGESTHSARVCFGLAD